jgi:short-subunit dehydrogenase
MNIVIIGGGTPNHWGNDLAIKAEEQGHDVRILSHKPYSLNNPKHLYADFDHSNEPVIKTFNQLTQDLTLIDLLLYNTVSGAGPWNPQDFTSQSRTFTEKEWLYNLRINVILPYELTVQALKKMNEASKIVYMTTGRSINPEDTSPPYIASYYGGKAWANHVMKSFSHYNDRSATALSVTSHFDYNNKEAYQQTFERAYDFVLRGIKHKEHNGRVITIQ